LTPHSQVLVLEALNRATAGGHRLGELFNY
jgi:hypothetical protein